MSAKPVARRQCPLCAARPRILKTGRFAVHDFLSRRDPPGSPVYICAASGKRPHVKGKVR